MNRQYCKRISNRVLEDTDHFTFYSTKESRRLAREVFEEMGLKVEKDMSDIGNDLAVMEVHR